MAILLCRALVFSLERQINKLSGKREDIRNIAIIAHVDHGKTTLVDAMLQQSHIFRENQQVVDRVMDSNDLERERGITILAKNTSVMYKTTKINIVDTPGHADFGGEVERVLNMVDGVLLLVDAVEGPMPQTRFVLRKAIQMGHKIIVVVNKIDRANARPDKVVDLTFDLCIDLNATDEQSDFPVVYTNAIKGTATTDLTVEGTTLLPLFETIVDIIPGPTVDRDGPFQMLVTTLNYDSYKGKLAIGRIFAGKVEKMQPVMHIDVEGVHRPAKIAQLFTYTGLERIEVPEAEAGDIIAVTGIPDVNIGETLADINAPVALPVITVDEPTLRMTFAVNNSPFAGREGEFCTSRHLRARLYKELETNLSLRVEDTDSADAFIVSGRGELHLAILIETMRREGYEFSVSKPEVIVRRVEGQMMEPMENLTINVPSDYAGVVVENISQRRGVMTNMIVEGSTVHYEFTIPTRGLLGFRNKFLTETRGTGIMNTLLAGYQPWAGAINTRNQGSLVASEDGVTSSYGLNNAQERGDLFIGSGVEVYGGMIIGRNQRDVDLDVNPCKKKHLTNMRSSAADEGIRLVPPINMSLDDCLEYLADDELVEVTPKAIRLRKRLLDANERGRTAKRERLGEKDRVSK